MAAIESLHRAARFDALAILARERAHRINHLDYLALVSFFSFTDCPDMVTEMRQIDDVYRLRRSRTLLFYCFGSRSSLVQKMRELFL